METGVCHRLWFARRHCLGEEHYDKAPNTAYEIHDCLQMEDKKTWTNVTSVNALHMQMKSGHIEIICSFSFPVLLKIKCYV